MSRFVVDGRVVEVRRKLGSWTFAVDGRASARRYMSQARAAGAALLAAHRVARAAARRSAAAEAAKVAG